jgi:hypothetical protein
MKFKALAVSLLLMAAPVFAAGVDGNWAGSIDSPNGPIEIKFTFKADGEKVTGNTTSPDGAVVAIKNGKVTGNNLAFTVDLDMGGQAMSFQYTGVLAGDDLKLHTEFMGMPFDFTVKKTK